MLIASRNRYGMSSASSVGIYTRNRQNEYKRQIHKTHEDKVKVSPKTLYFLMFFVVILLFCSWFGMIFFKSVISGVQMDINNLNSQIRSLEQENSVLQAEKISALNIESIKKDAERMGMSLPSAYQVEYVDTDQISANLKIID